MTMTYDLFIQIAYALGIGLLIGLERSLGGAPDDERSGDAAEGGAAAKEDPGEFLGLRTFGALSLTGFAAGLAADRFPLVAPVALLGVSALVIAMYHRATAWGTGITTEVAAIATCALGMLCHHHPQAASVLGLTLTVLLAAKRYAHQAVQRVKRVELTDTLKFLVAVLIVLPLLPQRALDPWGAFNPFKVGLLVVLISGIGFVGYFLTRILGAQRGLGLTGIIGGLTSSTAVTAAMAGTAKRAPGLIPVCAFATVAANATMFVRVLVVVAVLDPLLALRLAWSISAMAAVAVVASLILWIQASRHVPAAGESSDAVPLKNPFSVGPALKFAAMFVLILFVAKLAKTYLGNQGLYLAAGLSGLADVDAITLSLGEATRSGVLNRTVAAIAITIAVVANGIVKIGIAWTTGGGRFGRVVAVALGLATSTGLGVAILKP